jgi:tripartite-type tricarboxylate transporter receptor subunit TctC
MAAQLGQRLGGSFIVENRSGAGGNIGVSAVAKAEPDGYTLLVMSSALVVNPSLYKRVPFDPVKDFAPLTELGAAANIFVANPATKLKTLAELIARAKADPAAFSYSSAGIGTTPHLSGELLKQETGIKMTHIPFSGAGPAVEAVLAGTTPLGCASIPPALPHIKIGALNALAVTSQTRSADLPDVPTMVELGYPDFIADTFQAFLAPAATPKPILELLAKTAVDILNDKAVHAQLVADGFEVRANGPDGLRRRIEEEVPKWRAVIAKAGISTV